MSRKILPVDAGGRVRGLVGAHGHQAATTARTGCWKTCWWCSPSALLVFTYKSFPLSRVSYTCIFVFMMLHALGAHYTYAKVPYEEWFPFFAGGRNHFDRLVHFLYGLLLAYPIREMFLRIGNVRGFWGYFLPLDLTMSTSMLYELIEWGAAEVRRRRARRGLPRHAGRHLGCAQGHGAGVARRADRDDASPR